MTLLLSRATPDHAFVASDHRHMVEEAGEETALDLGPKLYPLAAGFGASGNNGASGPLCAVQAARLTRDLPGADLGAVHELLADAYGRHAPDVPPEVEDDLDADENPANGCHVLALRRGGDGFGAAAFRSDGALVEGFTEGLFVAVSAGLQRAHGGQAAARRSLEAAWADGEEPPDLEGDLRRFRRLLAAATDRTDDVAPVVTVAGVDGDGARFVRRVEVEP